MKQNILIMCIFLIVSSCSQAHVEENDIAKYDKYSKEKQDLAQKYYDLMQSPEENKSKLQKLDQRIHEINMNLKQLSMKEHVRDYLRIKYFKHDVAGSDSANTSRKDGSVNKSNPDEFDYYVDNDSIDTDYDFSNKDFAETTNDNTNNDKDIEDESSSNSREYIEPDEGFNAKDVTNTKPEDVNNDNMESAEGENIDEEYEFEDESKE